MIKFMIKVVVLLAFLACAFSKPLQGVKGGRRQYDDREVYTNPSRNDNYYDGQYGSRLEDGRNGRDRYHDRNRYDGQYRASGGQDILTDDGRDRARGPVGSQDENRSRGRPIGRISNYDDQDVRYHGRDNYDAKYVG